MNRFFLFFCEVPLSALKTDEGEYTRSGISYQQVFNFVSLFRRSNVRSAHMNGRERTYVRTTTAVFMTTNLRRHYFQRPACQFYGFYVMLLLPLPLLCCFAPLGPLVVFSCCASVVFVVLFLVVTVILRVV